MGIIVGRGRGCFVLRLVLLECFFDGNSLEFGLFFGFFEFDGFVVGKMLEIFGVVVSLVSLCFWC